MTMRSSAKHFGRSGRQILPVAGLLAGLALAVPEAHAQTAVLDTSLRTIAAATITQASFDARARGAIQSIGPATLENRTSIVPLIYDPSVGRFVSALGNARGAIPINSSSAVSVIVTNQQSAFTIGAAQARTPLPIEAQASPSTTIATPQISTTPASVAR